MVTQEDSLAYYNHNAEAYAKRTSSRLNRDALREFLTQIPAGGRILDAGCAAGRDLRYFGEHGYPADGLDASPEMVKLAQEQLAPLGIRVWQADLRMLSVPKESYDGIWAQRVLHHFSPDACRRVMASFFMALRPRGILFASFEEGSGKEDDQTDDPQGPVRSIFKYQTDDVASLIRQNGFQILSQGKELGKAGQFGFIARRL